MLRILAKMAKFAGKKRRSAARVHHPTAAHLTFLSIDIYA
jgi:hypothetical protein